MVNGNRAHEHPPLTRGQAGARDGKGSFIASDLFCKNILKVFLFSCHGEARPSSSYHGGERRKVQSGQICIRQVYTETRVAVFFTTQKGKNLSSQSTVGNVNVVGHHPISRVIIRYRGSSRKVMYSSVHCSVVTYFPSKTPERLKVPCFYTAAVIMRYSSSRRRTLP